MMNSDRGGLLVDTGFFIALYDARDQHHDSALSKEEWLEMLPVILPWPVLYETINTRFSRRRDVMMRLDAIVTHRHTELLDDSRYRDESYRAVIESTRRGPRLSLVDAVLQAIIEDTNVDVSAMLTFNPKDFNEICARNSVELL